MDLLKFRTDFPEFGSSLCFADEQLRFWGELAELEISLTRFGPARPYAVELLVAHYMGLSELNGTGNSPGVGGALVAGKAVGSASIKYDTSQIHGVPGSSFMGTRYGTMLSSMMRRYGAGALVL